MGEQAYTVRGVGLIGLNDQSEINLVKLETELRGAAVRGIANTSVAQVGSTGGKPLYLRGQLSTDKTFGGTVLSPFGEALNDRASA